MSCARPSRVSTYRGLPEQEAFDIEYWLLEEAKLKRQPPPKPLAGRIAIVTGGAGGIGAATARDGCWPTGLASSSATSTAQRLAEAEAASTAEFGADRGPRDLGRRHQRGGDRGALSSRRALAYGGLDICVSNAGMASAAPIEDTSLALWRRNMDILVHRLFPRQPRGGAAVQGPGAGRLADLRRLEERAGRLAGASAYGAAKASELHLARLLAVECAPMGVRVNVVNPDAVLQGSRIWQGEWRNERAQQHKADPADLEAVYRERSLLKRSVYPEDVAEAVVWFASDVSAQVDRQHHQRRRRQRGRIHALRRRALPASRGEGGVRR